MDDKIEVMAMTKHYTNMAIEPLETMRMLLTREEYIGFLKGNIIKYSMRQGQKDGEPSFKDASKARDYGRLLAEFSQSLN